MKVRGKGQIIPLENKANSKCRKWQIRVSTGKDPRTGKYKTRSKNVQGTYTDAYNALALFRIQAQSETRRNGTAPTIEQLGKEYIEHKLKLGLASQNTAAKYTYSLKSVNLHLGKARVNEVEPFMVSDMYKALLDGQTTSGKPMSGTSVRTVAGVVSGMFSFAVKQGYIRSNPAQGLDLPRNDTKEKEALTEKQVKHLIACLDTTERHGIAVLLALLAGLRRGEVCALVWGDIDLIDATINVRHSMTVKGEIKAPKTKASRALLPMSLELRDVLAPHKEQQRLAMDRRGVTQGNDTYVLADILGDALTPNGVNIWWRRHRKDYGLEGVGFHCLRHTFITRLARAGVHISTMQKLARHASVAMTARYTHIGLEDMRVAVNRLE